MKRKQTFHRKTKETEINGFLKFHGSGEGSISTGIGFMDHMLTLFRFHSGFDLELVAKGDLEVCPHHTIEDIALCLGDAVSKSLGDRMGIRRYSYCYLSMDETLTRTVIDLSGRPYHVFRGVLSTESIGDFPTEMVSHFFYSFAMSNKMTLHQEILYGENDHHKTEALFKGFGKTLADSVTIVDSSRIPSSKGVL